MRSGNLQPLTGNLGKSEIQIVLSWKDIKLVVTGTAERIFNWGYLPQENFEI